jgi:thiamine biosynthesis lipoprotein
MGVVQDDLPGVRCVEQIMGMPIVLDVRDTRDVEQLDEIFDWFRSVDRTFSTYLPDSEISRINRGDLLVEHAHPDVREVLGRCDELLLETDGFFDVHAERPDVIDPSGLVKGWAVDRAADLAAQMGLRHFAINAGGDMRLRGGALHDSTWRVGIQHPTHRGQIAAVVSSDELAVATSGNYARGEHVLDPHTHEPPSGALSVTITGPELATADAYATAALAMGTDGPAWTAHLRGYEAMTILDGGTVLSTPGFPNA